MNKYVIFAIEFVSIQKDRHRVEQFHILWSNSQKVEHVPKAGLYSTNCGTVPQNVELFHFVLVFLDIALSCL